MPAPRKYPLEHSLKKFLIPEYYLTLYQGLMSNYQLNLGYVVRLEKWTNLENFLWTQLCDIASLDHPPLTYQEVLNFRKGISEVIDETHPLQLLNVITTHLDYDCYENGSVKTTNTPYGVIYNTHNENFMFKSIQKMEKALIKKVEFKKTLRSGKRFGMYGNLSAYHAMERGAWLYTNNLEMV